MELSLAAGDRQIDLSSPVCMGILNVTPDSFSDGAQFAQGGSATFRVDVDKALRRAEQMVAEGAAILDVGGESTRPGAQPVTTEEELDRVVPIVAAIRARLDVCISVDTSSPAIMQAAIAAGAGVVNDVRALGCPGALDVAGQSTAAICLMHMQGQPGTMQQTIAYNDVVEEVIAFLQARVSACEATGIDRQRIVVDPGFGFGKTLQHNFQLLKNLQRFTALGLPLMVGLSRKSMIAGATDRPVTERLAGSVAATSLALLGGANIIRTHDVAATIDAIRVHSVFSNA